jgi:hypothetical protein
MTGAVACISTFGLALALNSFRAQHGRPALSMSGALAGRHEGTFHPLSGHLAHEVTFLAWNQTRLCGKFTWIEFVRRADARRILLPGF